MEFCIVVIAICSVVAKDKITVPYISISSFDKCTEFVEEVS